ALGLRDEAVHLCAVNICDGVDGGVWPTAVDVIVVVIGRIARAGRRIRRTHRRLPALHRKTIYPRKRPEIAVKGTFLLHHPDYVTDRGGTTEAFGRGRHRRSRSAACRLIRGARRRQRK